MPATRKSFDRAVHYSTHKVLPRAVIGAVGGTIFHGDKSRAESAAIGAARSVKYGAWRDIGTAGGRAGVREYKKRKGETTMAKKGSWKGGNAPAQGSTKRRVSRPVDGKLQKPAFKKGFKKALKKGTSPLDGRRKRGKK